MEQANAFSNSITSTTFIWEFSDRKSYSLCENYFCSWYKQQNNIPDFCGNSDINIDEINVYDASGNHLNGIASQISDFDAGGTANHATDGLLSTNSNTNTFGNGGWFEVDLGSDINISEILIINRV